MKKLIIMLLVISLTAVMLIGCTKDKDRAENNGKVTDDTTEENLMDDASSAIDDLTDGMTDDRTDDRTDTTDSRADDTSSDRKIGGPIIGERTN